MYNKIGVIGDKDSVLAFKAIGVDVFYAVSSAEARELIRKLDKDGYAVIFITENFVGALSETLVRYKTVPYPAIIPIPQSKGSMGVGMKSLKEDMEKAIGTDILFKK